MIKAFNKHLNLKINEFVQTKATTCLLPSGLLLLKCVAHACMDVCVHACVCRRIIVVNQPSSWSLNLMFRLRLFSELIYMLLMSPLRCAFRPEAERTSLFSKFRESQLRTGPSLFKCNKMCRIKKSNCWFDWSLLSIQKVSTLNLFLKGNPWFFLNLLPCGWMLEELLSFNLNIIEPCGKLDVGREQNKQPLLAWDTEESSYALSDLNCLCCFTSKNRSFGGNLCKSHNCFI